jgi:glycosyltransferase involved in cell wall biosynthesis
MVGTDQSTMGGIASVVRGYVEGGLFERVDGSYVATHRDGGPLRKASAGLRGCQRVAWQLATGNAPLVHIHMSSRASFWRKSAVTLLARAARRPYLLHMHGSEFMRFYQDESTPRVQALVRGVLERAALVLALSEEWRSNLLGICPRARVEILPNAVAVPPHARLDAAGADARIVFLGRLGARKGTFDLVKAFAQIAPRHPTARLICAGDGAVAEIRALAQTLGVADRVETPGWVDRDASRAQLAGATLFALPSHAEGLPMALLEAMSWGLPVVTTPVGGIPQVVRDGETGLLVPAGDPAAIAAALDRLLADAPLRRTLGSAARATIERGHSLAATIDAMVGIYARFGIAERARVGPRP